jgi:hypothetical protein
MYARIARYAFSGDAHELAQRAEEEILPILKGRPGFKTYSLVQSDGEIISFSAWETAEAAEAANPIVAEWVADKLSEDVELKETIIGDVLVATQFGISARDSISV